MHIPQFIRTFWRWKLIIQRFLLVIFSAAFSMLLFAQVCFRYFFDIPLFGIEEVAVYLAMWVYFIGATYACYERYHISASLVDVFLDDGKVKTAIDTLALLIGFCILSVMSVWCAQYLIWSAKFNMQSVELDLPMAFINSISVVGLTVSALYMLLEVIDKATEVITGKPLFPKEPITGEV